MAKSNHVIALVVVAAVALTVSLLAFVSTGKTAQASSSARNGLITFVSDRDGNDDIYLMNPEKKSEENPEDSATTRLTYTENLAEQYPALSPDGTKVAYAATKLDAQGLPLSPVNWEIYMMETDGSSEPILLTTNPGEDINPAWSPDGDEILFESLRNSNRDIYKMDAEDEETTLADGTIVPGPDGNGDNATRLTNDPAQDRTPAWSPDGNVIAFASLRPGAQGQDIFVMDSDPNTKDDAVADSSYKQLTNSPGFDGQPDFSPDGKDIAFSSARFPGGNSNLELLRMKVDGSSSPIRLTSNDATPTTPLAFVDQWPAWSPDGKKIAFWSGTNPFMGLRDGEILVMNSDGSGTPTNLTNNNNNSPDNPPGDIQPNWGRLTEEQCKDDFIVAGRTIFDLLGFENEDQCKVEAEGQTEPKED